MRGQEVWDSYMAHQFIGQKYRHKVEHIWVCPEGGLTVDEMEDYAIRSELKLGEKPKIIMIDYIQLAKSLRAKGRYERISDVAEGLKTLAKKTKTIVVVVSQISRPEDEKNKEVNVHDAKDSGSIENSAGLVLGVWRDVATDPSGNTMKLKVLKSTKGGGGLVIDCLVDGARMLITEKGKIDPQDVPPPAPAAPPKHYYFPPEEKEEPAPPPTPETDIVEPLPQDESEERPF